jgi:hypothetical protein
MRGTLRQQVSRNACPALVLTTAVFGKVTSSQRAGACCDPLQRQALPAPFPPRATCRESAAGSRGGKSLITLGQRAAFSLVSSGILEFRSINASSVMHSMHLRRTLACALAGRERAQRGKKLRRRQRLEQAVSYQGGRRMVGRCMSVKSGRGWKMTQHLHS